MKDSIGAIIIFIYGLSIVIFHKWIVNLTCKWYSARKINISRRTVKIIFVLSGAILALVGLYSIISDLYNY